jgi:hypothetical protein
MRKKGEKTWLVVTKGGKPIILPGIIKEVVVEKKGNDPVYVVDSGGYDWVCSDKDLCDSEEEAQELIDGLGE